MSRTDKPARSKRYLNKENIMESMVHVKDCFDNAELLAILAECVFDPTPERLKSRVRKYMTSPQTSIHAYKQNGLYAGIIVVDTSKSKQIEILEIAVRKELQRSGAGRKMIDFCTREFKPDIILAETDDGAVEFYSKVGFSIQSLGDKYGSGINRYLCTLPVIHTKTKKRGYSE